MNFICPKCGCSYESDTPHCPVCGHQPRQYHQEQAPQKREKGRFGEGVASAVVACVISAVIVLSIVFCGLKENYGYFADISLVWFILRLLFPPLWWLL